MSSLGTRLRTLAQQSGGSTGSVSSESGPDRDISTSVQQRLRRSMRTRAHTPAVKATTGNDALANALDGTLVGPSLIRLESRYPRIRGHGHQSLAGEREAAVYLGHPHASSGGRIVFFDTETTGLAGGTGTVVFMVGLAWFDGPDLLLRQYLMSGFGGEPGLLQAVTEDLEQAELLVSFNGKSFDVTQLETRYRLASLPSPLRRPEHLDLLFHVRRMFARRWPNCRLSTVEPMLLGFQRHNDLPGSMAPTAWLNWLRMGRTDMLCEVAEHNRWDLVSLAALLPAIDARYRGTDANVDHSRTATWLATVHGDRAALEYLQRHRDNLDLPAQLELARTARRIGDWSLAVDIWQELARQGDGHAIEQLAKYFEHRLHDYRTALAWAETLLTLERDIEAHRRRHRRLLRKCASCSG